METDYHCYLLGCRSAGATPLSPWRFRLLQNACLRYCAEQEQHPQRTFAPPPPLERLVWLITAGYKIAAGSQGDEGPGPAACGVREPRPSPDPLLTAAAARILPSPDAHDQSFWRV